MIQQPPITTLTYTLFPYTTLFRALASARAESAEVKDLAERIAAAQAREVEQMVAWLEDWGEPGEADGMDGILPGESVMMTDDDMSALEASNGQIGRAHV